MDLEGGGEEGIRDGRTGEGEGREMEREREERKETGRGIKKGMKGGRS